MTAQTLFTTTNVHSTKKNKSKSGNKQGRLDSELLHASQLEKPQRKFRRKVDNSNTTWQPILRHKYNAKVPLGYNFHPVDESTDVDMETVTKYVVRSNYLEQCTYGPRRAPHPYGYEIKNMSYPQRLFVHADVTIPRSFTETPFTWVDTTEKLERLIERLRSCQEIAVDLEHHSYRSYSGFLCLMQISTREEDFIIDTLCLRDELEDLNEIFTDPNVIKVCDNIGLWYGYMTI